jgi:hypothetical protein
MAFDAAPGGEPLGPVCRSCRRSILHGQRAVPVRFSNDPDGSRGLTGVYHEPCSKPFLSLARAVNLNPWSRF